MSYNWEEETKADARPQHYCHTCGRTENHGALFNYHTHGVDSPYGYTVKLGQHCTECVDKLRKEVDVPYYLLDNYMHAEKSFDFYARKVENKGGDIESLKDSKVQILREYCKLVDKNIIASTRNEIDESTFTSNCMANASQLVEWIANVGGVAKSAITSNGTGFKKVDN
jgi:hypothetical protein